MKVTMTLSDYGLDVTLSVQPAAPAPQPEQEHLSPLFQAGIQRDRFRAMAALMPDVLQAALDRLSVTGLHAASGSLLSQAEAISAVAKRTKGKARKAGAA